MLPLALTASPAGAHPPDESMPDGTMSVKALLCSTAPPLLIWATPPASVVAVVNAGTEIQNEAPPFTVVCGFHTGCSKPPLGACPGIVIWLLGMGAPTRVTGGCPLLVENRLPNAGVAALLAVRTWESRGLKAISSTRIPVAAGAVAILYRVPEIVTRGRFPDGGESDSTWRTQEARHVGSDTIAPGF